MSAPPMFLIVCARHDPEVPVALLIRGHNGLTDAPSWRTLDRGERLVGDRRFNGVLTQEVADTGAVRERLRLVCPECGDDVPARQEKLDAALERCHAAGVSRTDMDGLRLIL